MSEVSSGGVRGPHRSIRGKTVYSDPKIATALLRYPPHHCGIVEIGKESWRFKNRS